MIDAAHIVMKTTVIVIVLALAAIIGTCYTIIRT